MNNMNQLFNKLDRVLFTQYDSVNATRNPVCLLFDQFKLEDKLFIVTQYSLFSRYIVKFLIEVLYKVSLDGHVLIVEEVRRNIDEELGGSTGYRLPHYILLIKGFKFANLDIYSTNPSIATKNFESMMLAAIYNGDGVYASGVAYALEASAVHELKITREFVIKALQELGVVAPKEIESFFNSHISEIEVMHEARLQEASLQSYSTDQEIAAYGAGFHKAMTVMDAWWHGLAREVPSVN